MYYNCITRPLNTYIMLLPKLLLLFIYSSDDEDYATPCMCPRAFRGYKEKDNAKCTSPHCSRSLDQHLIAPGSRTSPDHSAPIS